MPPSNVESSDKASLRVERAGLLVCAILAATWAWWATKDGAYFGVVLLPGGIVLCATAAVLARYAPWGVRLRPPSPAGVALFALVALGAWAALSALWSPAPAAAVADGQRILLYAVAFALGLWLVDLLRSRPSLALLPLAFAGAFAGVATAIGLATGDDATRYLAGDETLQYPLGYRNANAAFFLIALFPAIGLAADRTTDWRIRGLALGTATLCIDLALLSQSRGSVPAAAIACGIYLFAAPLRLRALVALLLAALPALGVLPALTDLFQAEETPAQLVDDMHAAGAAVALTAAAATLLGWLAGLLERGRAPRPSSARSNRAVAVGLAAAIVAGAVVFLARIDDPADWIDQRAHEFSSGTPMFSEESSRFTFQVGSNRTDFWRVAVEDASDHLLRGNGGGSFQYTYARARKTEGQDARDAHSIELEVLAELGGVGLLLLLIGLGAITVGVVRARRSGAAAAGVSAIALGSSAYWLAHSSIDWFFHYPALTAPTIALLGSACAGAVRREPQRRAPAHLAIVAVVVALAISLVPPYLSERYVNDGYAGWRHDLPRAYDDLDRAAALNPLSDTPLLAEGAIAQAAGDPTRANEALREAVERVPDEWATHYLLAEIAAADRPQLARRELEIARRLNPLSDAVRALREALGDPDEIRRVKRQRRQPEERP